MDEAGYVVNVVDVMEKPQDYVKHPLARVVKDLDIRDTDFLDGLLGAEIR